MRVRDSILVNLLDTNDKSCILLAMMLLTEKDFIQKRVLMGSNRKYEAGIERGSRSRSRSSSSMVITITNAKNRVCNWWICQKCKDKKEYWLDIPTHPPFV